MAAQLSLANLPELARRREFSQATWAQVEYNASIMWEFLESSGNSQVPEITKRACIFVTGSFAREEAYEASDLDLFVLHGLPDSEVPGDGWLEELTFVESAHLIAALDNVRAQAGLRTFSRGGKFIQPHSFEKLLTEIGSPQDDATNSFTARILLLTGSKPLLNTPAYTQAKKLAFDPYWARSNPEERFLPIMLINDLRRFWGVLCLNFELYNKLDADAGFEANPGRRIENLKLRYTKLLGVYSAVLGLIDLTEEEGILRSDAESVFDAFPADRLLAVGNRHASSDDGITDLAWEILQLYDQYLEFSAQDKDALLQQIQDEPAWHEHKQNAYEFHRKFVRLFSAVGEGRILYEYTIV